MVELILISLDREETLGRLWWRDEKLGVLL